MKLYSVFRLDRTDGKAPEIRKQTLPAHREYMQQFGSRVRLGGPLQTEAEVSCGGLMVIEAEDLKEVERIVKEDPFEIAGLSETIHINFLRWQTNRPTDLLPL